MIFGAENSGTFKTRANGFWTIFLQSPVVSMTSWNIEFHGGKRGKLCYFILFRPSTGTVAPATACFKAHHYHFTTSWHQL